MKILLLADLHGIRPWYRWVTAEAGNFDLVCIAGDLIDMFRRSDEQIDFIRDEWLPTFSATGVPLAVCSGNHDHSIAMWLSHPSRERVVADGVSCLLEFGSGEHLIVTTCPYIGSFNAQHPETANLWLTGEKLKKRHRVPWLVLHHEPPAQLAPERVINPLDKRKHRARLESVAAVATGKLTVGDAVRGYLEKIRASASLKPRSKDYREMIMDFIDRSWPAATRLYP